MRRLSQCSCFILRWGDKRPCGLGASMLNDFREWWMMQDCWTSARCRPRLRCLMTPRWKVCVLDSCVFESAGRGRPWPLFRAGSPAGGGRITTCGRYGLRAGLAVSR